jgi:hypothetical protein
MLGTLSSRYRILNCLDFLLHISAAATHVAAAVVANPDWSLMRKLSLSLSLLLSLQ